MKVNEIELDRSDLKVNNRKLNENFTLKPGVKPCWKSLPYFS